MIPNGDIFDFVEEVAQDEVVFALHQLSVLVYKVKIVYVVTHGDPVDGVEGAEGLGDVGFQVLEGEAALHECLVDEHARLDGQAVVVRVVVWLVDHFAQHLLPGSQHLAL